MQVRRGGGAEEVIRPRERGPAAPCAAGGRWAAGCSPAPQRARRGAAPPALFPLPAGYLRGEPGRVFGRGVTLLPEIISGQILMAARKVSPRTDAASRRSSSTSWGDPPSRSACAPHIAAFDFPRLIEG